MTEHPSLDQLYRDVATRRKRKERIAMVAYLVLTTLAAVVFVVALFTPQP